MPEELWTEVRNTVKEVVNKTIPKKKKCKNAKWLSEESLQIAEKRREAEDKRRKGKINPSECRVPKDYKEREESLPQQSMQRNSENKRMGKTRDLFRKLRDTKGTFHAKIGTRKDRNGMDLTEAERLRRGGKNTQKN